jgi:cytosine/adenosine deaminase-related metal-dependent hydrolase
LARTRAAAGGPDAPLDTFTVEDYRDLQVLFNLAWTDPDFLAEDPLADLVSRGRSFTEADKAVVLGEHERISAESALRAVTLGSAYQMHLDAEFGTIECGKAADFTVLEDSPLSVDPMAIKDIAVWGTIVGGTPFEAAHP